MPWIAIVCVCLVGACSFDADYGDGSYACRERRCPSGLECRDELCVEPRKDAASGDAPPGTAELSCALPGALASGASVSGTTEGRTNKLMPLCMGSMQFAPDAVYAISTTAPNQQLTVTITGALHAYVLSACTPSASCLGGALATSGNSLAVTAAAAASYFVVVDHFSPTTAGDYTLTVVAN